MAERVLLLVGTKKGLFILESDLSRASWRMRGPLCESWSIHAATLDPATGSVYAGGGNAWYGPALWRSDDLGDIADLRGPSWRSSRARSARRARRRQRLRRDRRARCAVAGDAGPAP